MTTHTEKLIKFFKTFQGSITPETVRLIDNPPVELVEAFPELNWNWGCIDYKKKPDIQFVKKFSSKPLNWYYLSGAISLNDIGSNLNFPWNWKSVSIRTDILLKDILSRHGLPWNWKYVSRRSDVTVDVVLANPGIHWDLNRYILNRVMVPPKTPEVKVNVKDQLRILKTAVAGLGDKVSIDGVIAALGCILNDQPVPPLTAKPTSTPAAPATPRDSAAMDKVVASLAGVAKQTPAATPRGSAATDEMTPPPAKIPKPTPAPAASSVPATPRGSAEIDKVVAALTEIVKPTPAPVASSSSTATAVEDKEYVVVASQPKVAPSTPAPVASSTTSSTTPGLTSELMNKLMESLRGIAREEISRNANQ